MPYIPVCIAYRIAGFAVPTRALEFFSIYRHLSERKMETNQGVAVTHTADVSWHSRGGAGEGTLAWANGCTGSNLASGLGRWANGRSSAKVLDYDEVLFVLSGTFGISTEDGDFTATPGEFLNIKRGTTVTYFGTDAEFVFVVTKV